MTGNGPEGKFTPPGAEGWTAPKQESAGTFAELPSATRDVGKVETYNSLDGDIPVADKRLVKDKTIEIANNTKDAPEQARNIEEARRNLEIIADNSQKSNAA